MKLSRGAKRSDGRAASAAPPHDGTTDSGARRREILRVTFVRLLACAWLVRALLQWAALLGAAQPDLERASWLSEAATIFFAVLDPVTAVGLWLAAPWGVVIWLIALASQVAATLAIRSFLSPLWIGVDAALVALYLLSMGLVSRANRRKPAESRPPGGPGSVTLRS